jgi:bifunctional DNase/RNase
MIHVTVTRLAIDRTTNTPVVFLREAVGTRGVGIWIGAPEANAIALMLQGQTPPRPMTHDLLKAVIEAIGGRVRQVAVTAVRNGTYLAEIHLARADGTTLTLDARPSDAIALALRVGVTILAAEDLLDEEDTSTGEAPEPLSAEALREHLKRLGPEDFGRFLP